MSKAALAQARERLAVARGQFKQRGPKTFAKKARGAKTRSASGRAFPRGTKVNKVAWESFGALVKCRAKRHWKLVPGLGNRVRNTLALERARARLVKPKQALRFKTLFDQCQAMADMGSSTNPEAPTGRHWMAVSPDPHLFWEGCISGSWQRKRVAYSQRKVAYHS